MRGRSPTAGPIPAYDYAFATPPIVPTSAEPVRSVRTTVPEKPTRCVTYRLRLSPAEKATLDERAQAAGLKLAEYVRRECGVGEFERAALRRSKPTERSAPPGQEPRPTLVEGPDFGRRVNLLHRRMSRRAAESTVRREEAAERAKAALNG